MTTSTQAIDHREHCAYDLRRYGSQHALNMLQRQRHIRRQCCLRSRTARAYADPACELLPMLLYCVSEDLEDCSVPEHNSDDIVYMQRFDTLALR